MIARQSAAMSAQADNHRANGDFVLLDDAAGIYVVADGVGGRSSGELASRIAAEAFARRWHDVVDGEANEDPGHARVRDAARAAERFSLILESAVEAANAQVRQAARSDPARAGMSTTLSALVIAGGAGHIAHVGDSRIYRYRGEALQLLTADHTLVAQLVREGEITPEMARRHPLRNMLLRAVGAEDAILPQVHTMLDLAPGDVFVLASDGLEKAVDEGRLLHLLRTWHGRPAAELCRALFVEATRVPPADDVTVATVLIGPITQRMEGLTWQGNP